MYFQVLFVTQAIILYMYKYMYMYLQVISDNGTQIESLEKVHLISPLGFRNARRNV